MGHLMFQLRVRDILFMKQEVKISGGRDDL